MRSTSTAPERRFHEFSAWQRRAGDLEAKDRQGGVLGMGLPDQQQLSQLSEEAGTPRGDTGLVAPSRGFLEGDWRPWTR